MSSYWTDELLAMQHQAFRWRRPVTRSWICLFIWSSKSELHPTSLHFQHRLKHGGKQVLCEITACEVPKLVCPEDHGSLLLQTSDWKLLLTPHSFQSRMFTEAVTAPKEAGGGASKQRSLFLPLQVKGCRLSTCFKANFFNSGNIWYQSNLAVFET